MKKLLLLISLLLATNAWEEEGEISDTQSNSDNSIYLACEAGKKNAWSYKPGPHTIKDLLENKIDLTLDKKKKKMLARGFNSCVRYDEYCKKSILDGEARLTWTCTLDRRPGGPF